MLALKNLPAGICLMLAFTLMTDVANGQADPEWLRSWVEAVDQRPATLTSKSRIAPESEPGIPFVISGQVFNPDGTQGAGVIVFAYHRDRLGYDFGEGDRALTTWRLQGWAKTDAEGRFEFRSIRPAADHLGREGAHIHFTLESEQYGRQWARTVYLADDPLVPDRQRRRSEQAGEFAWVLDVTKDNDTQFLDVRFRLKTEGDF